MVQKNLAHLNEAELLNRSKITIKLLYLSAIW